MHLINLKMSDSAAGSSLSGFAGVKRYSTPESPGDIKMSHNCPTLSRFLWFWSGFSKGVWDQETVSRGNPWSPILPGWIIPTPKRKKRKIFYENIYYCYYYVLFFPAPFFPLISHFFPTSGWLSEGTGARNFEKFFYQMTYYWYYYLYSLLSDVSGAIFALISRWFRAGFSGRGRLPVFGCRFGGRLLSPAGPGTPDNAQDHFHDEVEFAEQALAQTVVKLPVGLGHFLHQELLVAVQVGGCAVLPAEGSERGAGEEGAVNVSGLIVFTDNTRHGWFLWLDKIKVSGFW
jgi:hypothetical protein